MSNSGLAGKSRSGCVSGWLPLDAAIRAGVPSQAAVTARTLNVVPARGQAGFCAAMPTPFYPYLVYQKAPLPAKKGAAGPDFARLKAAGRPRGSDAATGLTRYRHDFRGRFAFLRGLQLVG
jgi:hypothetical protein